MMIWNSINNIITQFHFSPIYSYSLKKEWPYLNAAIVILLLACVEEPAIKLFSGNMQWAARVQNLLHCLCSPSQFARRPRPVLLGREKRPPDNR
jgi:hypothetical protein